MTEPITFEKAGPGTPPEPPRPEAPPAEEIRRNSSIGLLLLAALAVWALVGGGYSLLVIILGLVLMIFFHELGHFLMAKSAGMKVTEFFLGFGPRIWSFHRGETEYGVKALPLGAYVKIIGMTRLDPVDEGDEDRAYWSKPYWRRFSVAVAGSTMHFIMAIITLWALLAFQGGVDGTLFPSDSAESSTSFQVRVADDGEAPTPAAAAGMQDGDKILSVDGEQVATFAAARDVIKARPDKTVPVTVLRDGQEVQLTVTLARNPNVTEVVGYLGVSPQLVTTKEGPLAAVPLAFRDFGRATVETFKGAGRAFSPSSVKRVFSDVGSGRSDPAPEAGSSGSGGEGTEEARPQSLIGAADVGAKLTRELGWVGWVAFFMQINIFIGFFNLLPMLPFDGGHVVIATYEKIRSMMRRGQPYYADVTKLLPVTYGLVALFLVFTLSLVYLDMLDVVSN